MYNPAQVDIAARQLLTRSLSEPPRQRNGSGVRTFKAMGSRQNSSKAKA